MSNFYISNSSLPHRKQLHVTPILLKLMKRNSNFQIPHSHAIKMVYSIIILKLPWLITSPEYVFS